MSNPSNEYRIERLESELRTLQTLVTALQGRVLELGASSARQDQPLQLYLISYKDLSYKDQAFVLCRDRIPDARRDYPQFEVRWLGEAAPGVEPGIVCGPA